MGMVEESLARQALQFGKPIPERIANAPQLQVGLQLYLQAFFDLDTERAHSNGPTPIPWTAMAAYADAYELDQEQREDLFFFVRRLDSVQLDRISKRMEAAAK